MLTQPRKGFLSPASELVARAAAELYLSGQAIKILFSTGYTSGKKFLSEAETIGLFVRDQYPGVPWEAMEIEKTSKNTETNGQATFEMIGRKELNVSLLSTSYHFPRASEAFERAGWKDPSIITCEDVLRDVAAEHGWKAKYEAMLEHHFQSDYYEAEVKKEKHLVAIARNKIGRALMHGATLLIRR